MRKNEKRESKMWKGYKVLSTWTSSMTSAIIKIKESGDLKHNIKNLKNKFNKKDKIIRLLYSLELPEELIKKIKNYYINKIGFFTNKLEKSENIERNIYNLSMILIKDGLKPLIDKDIKILDNNIIKTIKAKDSVYKFSYSVGEYDKEQHYTYIYDRSGKLLQKSRPLVLNRFFNKNRVVRISGKQIIPFYDEEEDEIEYETKDFQSRYIRFEDNFDLPATFGMMYDLIENKFISNNKKFNTINYNELKELNLLKK